MIWYAKLPNPVKLAIRTFFQAFLGSLSVTWLASLSGLLTPATRMSTLAKLLGPAALAGGSAVFTYLHNLVSPAPGTFAVPKPSPQPLAVRVATPRSVPPSPPGDSVPPS